jgi:hypothetical protein
MAYNCCWFSPAHSFSGQSPVGPMTIFLLAQIRDTPNLKGQVPLFIPPGTGWPGYTRRRWVPFSSPPTTRRGYGKGIRPCLQQFFYCFVCIPCSGNVFTGPLPKKFRLFQLNYSYFEASCHVCYLIQASQQFQRL